MPGLAGYAYVYVGDVRQGMLWQGGHVPLRAVGCSDGLLGC